MSDLARRLILYQGTVDDLKAKHPGEDLEAIFIKMIGETLE